MFSDLSKIVIHCGWHKTATSSIQTWAYQNRERLWEEGYFFPQTGYIRHKGVVELTSGHDGFRQALRSKLELQQYFVRLAKEFDALCASHNTERGVCDRLLLSCENLMLPNVSDSWLKLLVGELKNVEFGGAIEFIVVEREIEPWARSVVKEEVAGGFRFATKGPKQIEAEFLGSYKAKQQAMVRQTGRSSLRKFSYEKLGADPVAGFFSQALGVRAAEGKLSNPSPPDESLGFMYFANQNFESGPDLRRLIHSLAYSGISADVWKKISANVAVESPLYQSKSKEKWYRKLYRRVRSMVRKLSKG